MSSRLPVLRGCGFFAFPCAGGRDCAPGFCLPSRGGFAGFGACLKPRPRSWSRSVSLMGSCGYGEGRGIARALGLNEDLTEALCLAHDIGHPPFGHAGEDALKAAMQAHGGFDHNGHTLRTLARLECPYPRFDGLNLTWETDRKSTRLNSSH